MLNWLVWRYDYNKREIVKWNIFKHHSFYISIIENLGTNHNSKELFEEQLEKDLRYYFWCRAEYEVIIVPWCDNSENGKKTDIYEQIKLNWNNFVDYIWSFREEKLSYET